MKSSKDRHVDGGSSVECRGGVRKILRSEPLGSCRGKKREQKHGLRLAGGNSNIFLIFTPKIGEDFQFDSYFSDGLKPPISSRF